ncbi:hypothetical protein [Streptomyces sp. NBC_00690]|uniref:hypothetical protein n=1 Tax=Streptomyces sp. NBC_00690 TaxID=2975808 RepID=UPI002E29BA7F|nr:hypothetical protein [Streptomyces sp. NBC_00690]
MHDSPGRGTQDKTATAGETIDGAYQHAERVPFGQQVRLPVPFDLKLDTAPFPH